LRNKGGLHKGDGSFCVLLPLTQQQIAEIGVWRIGLQPVIDVIKDSIGELHLTAPLVVASAVWENRDAATTQTCYPLC